MPLVDKQIPNPKRQRTHQIGRASWYPFYAGFSTDFAAWAVDRAAARGARILLDPWNGSGTSTSAAAEAGVDAVGVDLNPAMVVVAKARLLDSADVTSLLPLAHQIVRGMSDQGAFKTTEPLEALFTISTAKALRSLERAIFKLLVESSVDRHKGPALERISEISPIAAFFYVAKFRVVRHLLRSRTSSNPTWIRIRPKQHRRISAYEDRLKKVFLCVVQDMLAAEGGGRPMCQAGPPQVSIIEGTSTSLPVADRSIDCVVTSPPYCTRLDYAVATLPELLVLGYSPTSTFDDLRRSLIGTTTVPSEAIQADPQWGPTAVTFLKMARAHRSKASATYYHKSHSAYMSALFASMVQISRKLKRGGQAVMVVQDSHYKELRIDLARIVSEMGASTGLVTRSNAEFPCANVLASSNPRVRRYRRTVSAVESVVILERQALQ